MAQQEIDQCYAIEDDSKALECLKDIVRAAAGDCRPQLVLLTQEDCTPCQEERAKHNEALKEGIIQELSVNSEKGMAIAVKNEIDFFPALVLLDCEGNIIYPSDIV